MVQIVGALPEGSTFSDIYNKDFGKDLAGAGRQFAQGLSFSSSDEIEAFMSSRSVMPMILSGEDVIAKVRDLLGPTNSLEAPNGTIRGDLGTDMMRNVVHASDSPETAAAEKKRFFPDL